MSAIRLSDHFSYRRLLRFTAPPILMMVFTSIYVIVDGIFIANFVGEVEFASVNLIMPYLMLFDGVAFMLGAGGSALVAKTLGEGNKKRANEYFSLVIYVMLALGTVITLVSILLMRPIAQALGATEEMLPHCVTYGSTVMLATIPFMLQSSFQTFLITAERPKLGLYVTVGAGVTNMILDALFMAVFHWGVIGAAAATAIGNLIGGGIPLIYFALPNKSTLRLGKTKWYGKALLRACGNGVSECVSSLSRSFVGMLYNLRLMQLVGEGGVAAYGVIMYVNFIFISVFLGFSDGSAPIVGFHFGARNKPELKSLLRKCTALIGAFGFVMTLLAGTFSAPLAHLFVGADPQLSEMTAHALRVFALSFLLVGFNIYASAFFTALNNGLVSAVISVGRSLVFEVVAILVLSNLFGLEGLWFAAPTAALLALVLAKICYARNRKKYGY